MRNSRILIKNKAPISPSGFKRLHRCWGGMLVVLGSFLLAIDIVGFILRDDKLILGIGIVICLVCVVSGSLACHVGHRPSRCTLFCSGLLNIVGSAILCAATYLSFTELMNRQKKESKAADNNDANGEMNRLLYYRCLVNIASSLTGAILLLGHSFVACFNCSSCSKKSSEKYNHYDSNENDSEGYLETFHSGGGHQDLRPNLATAPPLELMEIDPRYSYNNYDSAPPTYDSCFQDGVNRYSVSS